MFLETPASQKHLHKIHAGMTAADDGLKITQFPAARDAAIPPVGMAMGKFHGEITIPVPLGKILRLFSL